MPPRFRRDVGQWRELLSRRGVNNTWRFDPLCCVPSILFHGRLYSIERQQGLGLHVPQRESREDDIAKGVGDVVKLSANYPYWKMLSCLMREGRPEVMLELTVDPILWEGTCFGNGNVWEAAWEQGEDFNFACEKVFVPRSKWDTTSPPEIYVPRELPLEGVLIRIHTVLEEEREELESCLDRLNLLENVELFTAGFSSPFPNECREDYLANRAGPFDRVRKYLRQVTRRTLEKGVEIE